MEEDYSSKKGQAIPQFLSGCHTDRWTGTPTSHWTNVVVTEPLPQMVRMAAMATGVAERGEAFAGEPTQGAGEGVGSAGEAGGAWGLCPTPEARDIKTKSLAIFLRAEAKNMSGDPFLNYLLK